MYALANTDEVEDATKWMRMDLKIREQIKG